MSGSKAGRSDPRLVQALEELAPEFGKSEFLLCVDDAGASVAPGKSVRTDLHDTLAHHPGFGRWFRVSQVDGAPVLLVARWLCHLAGFRHRTVQLFLEHPTADAYTLMQVRGLDKAEAPGCFDLPAAGHVAGVDTIEEALFGELEEELGLRPEDLNGLVAVGRYVYNDSLAGTAFRNVEYRAVYSARLKPGALGKARFVDGEVAALALFSVSEIETLIERFPERVASGLVGSWPIYRERRAAWLASLAERE